MIQTIQNIINELERVKPSSYNDGYAGGYIDACDLAIKKLRPLVDEKAQAEKEGEDVPIFPNGYQSHMETYFFLSDMITTYYNENWQDNEDKECAIKQAQLDSGQFGLMELAKTWTNEFETTYSPETWEIQDWFGTLEEFFEAKNLSFVK